MTDDVVLDWMEPAAAQGSEMDAAERQGTSVGTAMGVAAGVQFASSGSAAACPGSDPVVWCGAVWFGVVWCSLVWCAEGAVTKWQWLGCLAYR